MAQGKKIKFVVGEGVTIGEKNGYTVILLTHDGRTQTVEDWAQEKGISKQTLYQRLRAGKTVDQALTTTKARYERHGKWKTPEFNVWQSMRRRCNDQNDKRYKDYGGRGIKVCKRWEESFQAFYDDMGPRPSDLHSLERKDNSGDYEPGNMVWATQEVQCRNTRTNVELTHNGRTMILKDWAREMGLANTTLWNRLFTLKWSVERALTTPQRRRRGEVKICL